MSREELIADLDRGFSALTDSFSGLTDAQMSEVWYGDWSVKDILAHVAGWHRAPRLSPRRSTAR